MKDESIMGLNLRTDGVYVDATLGYAGDSSEILKRVKKGFLFAFDQDSEAITWSDNLLSKIGNNYEIIKSNFLYMKEELESRNISGVDGILFDLGVSSPQLDEDYRGFSFHKNAKLDMRMDLDSNFSAYDVINTYDEKHLADIIFRYGEEKYAKSIAKNIVKERNIKKIETTFELVDIIKKSMPMKELKKSHPARKTFQAIRIEVNHELDILEESLEKSLSLLNVGGRVVVITFHSLEDRITKEVFKKYTKVDDVVKGLPNIPEEYLPNYMIINQKPITPSDKELSENNRSRSAKLRIIERIK
jgi:16S rRNA (cytosine1402-N4)-methyltransferase